MSTRDAVTVDTGDLSRRPDPVSEWSGLEPDHDRSLSRRGFLQRVGLGVATVFVVADGVLAYPAWESIVIPLTAILLLAIELPQLLGGPHPAPADEPPTPSGLVVGGQTR